MRKVVRSSESPRPRGPYSPGIIADGLVFVAGQAAVNPQTDQLELGDVRAETRRTLQNIRGILEAAGCSLKDVVKVNVYLADMKDFEAMNEVYREFFPEDPPARTTIGAQLPKIKVEIDCIARRHRRTANPYRATRRRFIGMD